MGCYTFKYEDGDSTMEHTIEFSDDVTWSDVTERFLQFLNGVGYVIDPDKAINDTYMFEDKPVGVSNCCGNCKDNSPTWDTSAPTFTTDPNLYTSINLGSTIDTINLNGNCKQQSFRF